jgi:hypothetical protein
VPPPSLRTDYRGTGRALRCSTPVAWPRRIGPSHRHRQEWAEWLYVPQDVPIARLRYRPGSPVLLPRRYHDLKLEIVQQVLAATARLPFVSSEPPFVPLASKCPRLHGGDRNPCAVLLSADRGEAPLDGREPLAETLLSFGLFRADRERELRLTMRPVEASVLLLCACEPDKLPSRSAVEWSSVARDCVRPCVLGAAPNRQELLMLVENQRQRMWAGRSGRI